MSVWDSVVGQGQVVQRLQKVACADASKIAQSWLICGAAGFGSVQVARAFAAALESPDHGECKNGELSKTAKEVLNGSHPDVHMLTTEGVTLSVDAVREVIGISEQMPSTAPWRIIIIEDVGRMLERSTNVLLKEIEEPSEHTIWLLCAASTQDVLPTIRSRTQVVQLAMPDEQSVVEYLMKKTSADSKLAHRAARLSQGNITTALLYASDEHAVSRRDELIAGLLRLHDASDAILLTSMLIEDAKSQAENEIQRNVDAQQKEFRRINGLRDEDRVPPKLRAAYNAIGKKDEVKRKITRVSRDVLMRSLDAIASVYRDVLVVIHGAQDSSPLINQEYQANIVALSQRFTATQVLNDVDSIAAARRRLAGNGNTTLVFEALFCSLLG
ncbi:DNA polymerase III, delta' subunit [Gardnerella vaginalis]|uniref:DNA polymerase III subunit delta' n=1 Tax=Gardnerella vaginalis TaxID=2702 RepID=A0A133P384_GARVA|nr:DNA polymerase III subunit delta' [Gardnerella vaginalis]KXA22972.1 DNA polymerase III, delta' subunit [Gardnerella vaginalis]